jgi:hypothetical protein
MATLKDLDDLMTRLAEASDGLTLHEFKRLVISEGMREFQGQKMYWRVPDCSKKQMVLEAARRLPTGVVATRCGVSNRYVQRLLKKR